MITRKHFCDLPPSSFSECPSRKHEVVANVCQDVIGLLVYSFVLHGFSEY